MTVWPWHRRTHILTRGYCVCNSHGYREYSTEFHSAADPTDLIRVRSIVPQTAAPRVNRRVVVIVSVGERSIVAGHSQARCGVCSRCPATAATATHFNSRSASVALRFARLTTMILRQLAVLLHRRRVRLTDCRFQEIKRLGLNALFAAWSKEKA